MSFIGDSYVTFYCNLQTQFTYSVWIGYVPQYIRLHVHSSDNTLCDALGTDEADDDVLFPNKATLTTDNSLVR